MRNQRKWLEGHVAPPSKSQVRGQGIHTAILRRDLRDASLENTSGLSFELCNSSHASQCKFAYTQSKIPSFEWCVTQIIIQIAHFALVWKPSERFFTHGAVCLQTRNTKSNFNYVIQMLVQRCFPVTILLKSCSESLVCTAWPLNFN